MSLNISLKVTSPYGNHMFKITFGDSLFLSIKRLNDYGKIGYPYNNKRVTDIPSLLRPISNNFIFF